MIVRALQCDSEECHVVATEEVARKEGWLLVGGGRRGRFRCDLCPLHARHALEQITAVRGKFRRKP